MQQSNIGNNDLIYPASEKVNLPHRLSEEIGGIGRRRKWIRFWIWIKV